VHTSELNAAPRNPDVGDSLDMTIATELQESLPSQDDPSDLDHTQYADPVEQAILVDRTRARQRGGVHQTADGTSPPPGSSTTIEQPSQFAISSPRPARAPSADGTRTPSGMLRAVQGEDLLGNYRLVAPIAAGGMGLLYLGEHCFLGYRVAIKILQPSLRGNQDIEQRFFAEAIATARIAHPGVPTVLDFGHDRRGTAYLVMEFLEGETLAAHMARGVTFTVDQVLDMAAQLAGILGAAHAVGVLHRDIKPDNIHLCPDPSEPSGFRVKLLDFGVAKLLQDKPPEAASTRHDYLVGTAWYMAPEQTFGPAGVDARSDVYAVGCVMFQVLCNRLPFHGEFEAVVQARRYQDPPAPRSFRPDLPRAVDTLVHRMLSRRPDDRPASMGDLERDLRALLHGFRTPSTTTGAPAPAPAAEAPRTMLVYRGGALRARAAEAAARIRGLVARAPRWTLPTAGAVVVIGTLLALIV
jgi:serine/threonine-protein kinase